MTTQAPVVRQGGSSSPSQPSSDQKMIQAVEAAISTGASATAIVAVLLPLLYGSGITSAGLSAALGVANQIPVNTAATAAGVAPALRGVLLAEPSYRAAFIFNAARRISVVMSGTAASYDQGVEARRDRVETFRQALVAEQRFWQQHRQAQINRVRAAKLVDAMSVRAPEGVLRWKAVLDSRTTPDCAAMNGQTFTVEEPPAIGWPGSVHPHCRCRAVPAS